MTSLSPIFGVNSALLVYDELPAGCTAHPVGSPDSEPLIRVGEFAVVGSGNRDLALGEMYLIQSSRGRCRIAVLEVARGVTFADTDEPAYNLKSISPQMTTTGKPIFMMDGPYPADFMLEKLIVGRVVGVLRSDFEAVKMVEALP
ncbi:MULTISPECIES: hypothetical protein [unclassified Chelatococcus]|uniref:hypothetical protein n=1 Tax=unclassified Chelatococcus TaxID=2638111 RepID=UPI001BCCFD01|nr:MULTISPECIES: hypothetical protein [unclassified Chelatococcus]MBS7696248.1 hypothetical protein [Chelatococcus sp. YT9]MBX3560076.1 hypothetical protein [Chelatococcus sp.]